MLDDKKIGKLTRRIYPSIIYSRKELAKLRPALEESIYDYIEQNKEITYQELKKYFLDDDMKRIQQELFRKKVYKIVAVIAIVIFFVCAVLFWISSNWEPPTYVY